MGALENQSLQSLRKELETAKAELALLRGEVQRQRAVLMEGEDSVLFMMGLLTRTVFDRDDGLKPVVAWMLKRFWMGLGIMALLNIAAVLATIWMAIKTK